MLTVRASKKRRFFLRRDVFSFVVALNVVLAPQEHKALIILLENAFEEENTFQRNERLLALVLSSRSYSCARLLFCRQTTKTNERDDDRFRFRSVSLVSACVFSR